MLDEMPCKNRLVIESAAVISTSLWATLDKKELLAHKATILTSDHDVQQVKANIEVF